MRIRIVKFKKCKGCEQKYLGNNMIEPTDSPAFDSELCSDCYESFLAEAIRQDIDVELVNKPTKEKE